MAIAQKFNFENPASVVGDEDDLTLAGQLCGEISEALAGCGVTSEQLLATLPQARKRVSTRYYMKRAKPTKFSTRRQRKK